MSVFPSFKRHPIHWDLAGDFIFLVGQMYYRLASSVLVRHSGMFREMFTMPAGKEGCQTEGSSEEDPIHLLVGAEPEFDIFVAQAYGTFNPPVTNFAVLFNTLKLSRYLIAPNIRSYALHAMESRKYYIDPVDLAYISMEFNTKLFFVHAFEQLVQKRVYNFSDADIQKLTYPVFVAVVRFIETLDEHRRIIACEAPPMLNHAPDCENHVRCAEDWQTIWWIGMGRSLLDGRNPLTYREAFKRFQLLQFGAVSEGCKLAIFSLIGEAEGFMRGYAYTKEYAEDIANKLIAVDPLDVVGI